MRVSQTTRGRFRPAGGFLRADPAEITPSVKSPRAQSMPAEVVQEVQSVTADYKESTIRTHVVSRMCADVPEHHAAVYGDLDRVAHGRYRRRGG